MDRTRRRLAGFAAALAVLFASGWLVGAQFPTDDDPTDHPAHDEQVTVTTDMAGMDHGDAP
ncbi:MAG: hypothetical protein U0Q03_20625 [Acidimicrobiales bacterium]